MAVTYFLALVAIADLIIPVIYGAALNKFSDEDIVGDRLFDDISIHRSTHYSDSPKAVCKYSSSNWQPKVNVSFDLTFPNNEISLKHLRALIIEIQEAIAKIEMIKFRTRSLWDCRVYKNPLQEIVIDIDVDATEIAKLIAKDKKWTRDKHELASPDYEKHQGNSLESQKTSSKEENNAGENSTYIRKSYEDSLKSGYQTKKDILTSNAGITSNVNRYDRDDLEIRNINVKKDEIAFIPSESKTENLVETSRETKENVNTKSNIYPFSKFFKNTKKTQVFSMPSMKSKHVSEEIEEISRNNFKLKNLIDKNKKDNGTFTNLSYLLKDISNGDNYPHISRHINSNILITEKSTKNDINLCQCISTTNQSDAQNINNINNKKKISKLNFKIIKDGNQYKDKSIFKQGLHKMTIKKKVDIKTKNYNDFGKAIDNNSDIKHKLSNNTKFSAMDTLVKIKNRHRKHLSIGKNMILKANKRIRRGRKNISNAPNRFNNVRNATVE